MTKPRELTGLHLKTEDAKYFYELSISTWKRKMWVGWRESCLWCSIDCLHPCIIVMWHFNIGTKYMGYCATKMSPNSLPGNDDSIACSDNYFKPWEWKYKHWSESKRFPSSWFWIVLKFTPGSSRKSAAMSPYYLSYGFKFLFLAWVLLEHWKCSANYILWHWN